MTEQQPEQQPGQEQKKKAGSIRQYATLGRGAPKTSERLDVQEPKRQDVQASERPDVGTPEHSGAETPKRERHTIYFPPDLSEWVKIRAVMAKREISEVVTEAVQRYKSEVEG
jgi:hypothetical protein